MWWFKNIRRSGLFFLVPFFLSAAVPTNVSGQEAVPRIQIGIAEKKTIPLDGVFPFAADDTILAVEEAPLDRVTLIGLKGGETQLFYWKEGRLQYLQVEVVIPPLLSSTPFGPRFRANRPYFLYDFQNVSSFSNDAFFQNALYLHGLQSEAPLSTGHLRSVLRYQHRGFDDHALVGGQVTYTDPLRQFSFGQTGALLSRVSSEAFSGVGFLGSSLLFRKPAAQPGRFSHEFTFFGGVRSPADLLKPEIRDQVYGSNYFLARPVARALYPDLGNVSLFTYQAGTTNQTFRVGGLLEGNYHLTPKFSLGGGFARGHGGFAGAFTPFFEREGLILSGRYSYVNHGLQTLGGGTVPNDRHRTEVGYQQLLADKITLLAANVGNDLSFRKGTSTVPSSNNQGAQFAFRRHFSFRSSYGAQYALNRSESQGRTVLTNAVSGSRSHSLSNTTFMNHGLSFTRSDLATTLNQISASTAFTYETEKIRSQTQLNVTFTRGAIDHESLSLQENFQMNFLQRGILDLAFAYNKSNLRDGDHQFQFGPGVTYQITSTHLVGLSGGASFFVGRSDRIQGTVALRYRWTFGPGVEPDPLWKVLSLKANRQPVQGDLFLDNNYNSFLDEGDTPLSNIPLALDGKKATTGPDGRFVFSGVKAGSHTLSLDPGTLPVPEPIEVSSRHLITTDGKQPLQVPIPVVLKKASIRVRFFVDVNDNGIADEEDEAASLPKVIFQSVTGGIRQVPVRMGEAVIRGVELGEVKVALDSADLPDNLELVGELEKGGIIREYRGYRVTYLLTPLRTMRGRVVPPKGAALPRRLEILLGPAASTVDEKGYYWLKKLSPGSYPLILKNLPEGHCLSERTPKAISIPNGPYVEEMDLELSRDCEKAPETSPASDGQ